MGDDAFGINPGTIGRMVSEIGDVVRGGTQVAIVIGGGNIFRGVAGGSVGMDRATADYMGMLATVMNALALSDALEKQGVMARVMSAISIEQVVEPYVRPKALQTPFSETFISPLPRPSSKAVTHCSTSKHRSTRLKSMPLGASCSNNAFATPPRIARTGLKILRMKLLCSDCRSCSVRPPWSWASTFQR